MSRLRTILSASLCSILPLVARAQTVELPNPLDVNSPGELIVNVINFVLGLVALAALVMFIYGGFVILTAHGNAEQFKKGTKTLVYAVIGILIILTSYSVLSYLFTNVFNFTAQ